MRSTSTNAAENYYRGSKHLLETYKVHFQLFILFFFSVTLFDLNIQFLIFLVFTPK